MKLAVIDCGTNTFNLIIIEVDANNQYTKLFNTRVPVKLGENSINEGIIGEGPFRRGISALNTFKEHLDRHKTDNVIAYATSAIREAANGGQFIKKAKDDFDIEITLIDGHREAELIYYGIREAVKMNENVSLIMDIGGGSNEFILANDKQIFWKQSFLIGAARVLEKFNHSNPISEKEKKEIREYLTGNMQDLFDAVRKYKPVELIGSSGAFESIVEMINGELGGEPLSPEKTEYDVDLNDNAKISELVFNSDLEQRRRIRGLVPMRFDMIVISCLMVNHVLESLGLKKLRVSTYSLKEGALIEHLQKIKAG
jgi:exopolyphosphatase/guanosine-5'-triphosphate,3'-diphosphate pyrophosphatase